MFLKEFEVRCSDVDANRHLANSAYINFKGHTRMAFLMELGFDHRLMAENKIGTVVFSEHMHYFKEVFPGKPVKVSLEVMGISNDGCFFEFHHNFYDNKGKNVAHCEMMSAWMSLESRQLTRLSQELLECFQQVQKPEGFRILTKEDTRKFAKRPKDLV